MKLIIINGLPATGKTTIAKPLSKALGYPVIAKDEIKEFLFDSLGAGSREWSTLLGSESNDFLYKLTNTLLANGNSIIVENAFERKYARPAFEALLKEYSPEIREIYCTTEKSSRRERFMTRNESGNRHSGHFDHVNYLSENDKEPLEKYAPIGLGKTIFIDTTNKQINLANLLTELT